MNELNMWQFEEVEQRLPQVQGGNVLINLLSTRVYRLDPDLPYYGGFHPMALFGGAQIMNYRDYSLLNYLARAGKCDLMRMCINRVPNHIFDKFDHALLLDGIYSGKLEMVGILLRFNREQKRMEIDYRVVTCLLERYGDRILPETIQLNQLSMVPNGVNDNDPRLRGIESPESLVNRDPVCYFRMYDYLHPLMQVDMV